MDNTNNAGVSRILAKSNRGRVLFLLYFFPNILLSLPVRTWQTIYTLIAMGYAVECVADAHLRSTNVDEIPTFDLNITSIIARGIVCFSKMMKAQKNQSERPLIVEVNKELKRNEFTTRINIHLINKRPQGHTCLFLQQSHSYFREVLSIMAKPVAPVHVLHGFACAMAPSNPEVCSSYQAHEYCLALSRRANRTAGTLFGCWVFYLSSLKRRCTYKRFEESKLSDLFSRHI